MRQDLFLYAVFCGLISFQVNATAPTENFRLTESHQPQYLVAASGAHPKGWA
jgi:hypothetical protein